MKKHKIKIIKNPQGMPLKIFIDDKAIMGADEIKLEYSYDSKTRIMIKKVMISLMDFEVLEITSQDAC